MTINGMNMSDRESAHAEIKHALGFPEYYGANLDALWDCLTEMNGDIELEHAAEMLNALGTYGCKLLQTFFEATGSNPAITFKLTER